MASLKSSLDSSTPPLLEEKQDDVFRSGVPPPSRKPTWGWGRLSVAALAIVSGIGFIGNFSQGHFHYGYHHQEPEHQDSPTDSDGLTEWSTITPSEKLVWQPCFRVFGDNLQCARLTVPMDYHRPLNQSADNPKVHIAMVLQPGANRTDDPSSYSESPLLINPGGPGGSGAIFAMMAATPIQTAIGPDRDIIGFDPRGVGATTPKADCFASPDSYGLDGRNIAYLSRFNWLMSGHDVGIVNSSNVALAKLNTRSKALAKLCKRIDDTEGDNSIFRYSNTPNVARDMLSIVNAWDEWRSGSDAAPPPEPMQEPEPAELQTVPKMEPGDSTKGKLVYWGFSYGTLLGATFASMFPDKVGRIILDGVVDADHYVDKVAKDNIMDADAIWDSFFTYCVEAKHRCQFYRFGDKPENMKTRFNDIMSWLEKEPVIAIPPNWNSPTLITASDFKMIIFSALYAPTLAFPSIAVLLKALVDGRLHEMVFSTPPALFCHNMTMPLWPDDAQKVIGCSDKRYRLNEGVDKLQEIFEDIATYSSFADVWMGVSFNLGCNGWEIDAKDPPMRWDDHPIHKPEPIDTSFPVLFLSNHLDPVTPLHSALKMTRKFSDASIIEQKAEGHCTLSCISLCMLNHIRAYLDKGIVPPSPKYDADDKGEWATCDCDEKPWLSLNENARIRKKGVGVVMGGRAQILEGKTAEEKVGMLAYNGLRRHFAKFASYESRVGRYNPLFEVHLDGLNRPYKEEPTCDKSS
ncbi:TAP-like protein-domain-containing protein [Hypomontagnella submonticulosa]|nr:TAP-like protein-domain-containing protein [Hypomontagnella submonticulosa]